MKPIPDTARYFYQATIATVSGLCIAAAVVFGAIALAMAGLMIGFAGALTASVRPRAKSANVVLTATRTGRGWIVDQSGR
jgi:hypothetical protein